MSFKDYIKESKSFIISGFIAALIGLIIAIFYGK